jgi:uncharacterized protein (TIGR03905 family)
MKKAIFILGLIMCFNVAANAQQQNVAPAGQVVNVVDDYSIVSDEVVDGVRYVVAKPSAKVCSRQIDIELEGNVITKVVYTRGCDGNAKGIGALIKGMTVEEAIRRLEGINCGNRGTSCPDQLAKILKAIK